MSELRHNGYDALDALRALLPGIPWHLVAIHPDTNEVQGGCVTEETLGRWLEAHAGFGVYYHVAPLRRAPRRGKANKTDLAVVAYLHADIDPEPLPAVGAPTPDEQAKQLMRERARIRALLEKPPAGVPLPTAIIDSGGGYQGLWALREPVDVRTGTAAWPMLGEVERHTRWLARQLGADPSTWNVDRILRLPGTCNWPNAKKRAAGRAPAMAELVAFDPARLYELGDFGQAEPEAAAERAEVGAVAAVESLDALRPYGVPAGTLDMIEAGPPAGADPSAARWAVLLELARADVPPELAAGVLVGWPIGWRESKGRQITQREAQRDAARAYGHVAAELANLPPLPDAEVHERAVTASAAAGEHGGAGNQAAGAPAAVPAGSGDDDEARAHLSRDDNGKPYSTQRNIRIAIRKLDVTLAHNLFTGDYEVHGLDGYGPRLDDPAIEHLWLRVDAAFGFRPALQFFLSVIEDAARRAPHHPVRDYLAELEWDGTPRIGSWLVRYGHADDTPYVRAVGELMLTAAVRRVRQPGCKFDEVVVLESEQGLGKSTAIRLLAVRDEWFTDALSISDTRKEVLELLLGKWIVELPEMSGMRKSEVEHMKAFASRQTDRARLAYARRATDRERQCVFVGSTNESEYMRDPTGARRMWPVRIPQSFDLEGLRRDRDQLWAEAAQREAAGASIRLPRELWAAAAEQQDQRRTIDPWHDVLSELLEDLTGTLSTDGAWDLIGEPLHRRTTESAKRLRQIMESLGWEHTRERAGGAKVRAWRRGTPEERRVQLVVQGGDGSQRVVAPKF